MEGSNMKQPLLDQLPQNHRKVDPTRRRLRRLKSAPVAEFFPGEMDDTKDDQSLPRYESILDKLHPSFLRVILYFIIYVTIGATCFYFVQNQIQGKKVNGVLDSVYFCVVTMTTVGYGNLVPKSTTAKLLASFFVFSGVALVGMVLSKGADYLVEKQETLLIKALHMRDKVGPSDIIKEMETNKVTFKYFVTTASLVVLIVVGTVFLAKVEKLSTVDAFYCVCSTVTTLGYGDKSFSTKAGRIFAIFWILASSICLAQFFLYGAEFNTVSRQKELVKWVLSRRMTNVDLEEADLDNNGVVVAAEFVVYKLKEMGKISQDDVSLLLDEFECLDFDQSGTLSTIDLTLSQSSRF